MGNSAIVTFEGINYVKHKELCEDSRCRAKTFRKGAWQKSQTLSNKKKLNFLFVAVAKAELKAPKIKKVNGGTDLRIKCKVTNRVLPHPAIAWYKDGALLTHDTVEIETKK